MLTADAISGNQSPPVILLGALLLSAGEVRSITIRPSRGAAPSTAIVTMPSSSTAVMRDCDVTAAPQAVSPTVGSTRLSSRASSACAGSLLRAPSRAGAAGSGGSGGSVAISVGRGSTARIERCRLRNGGISIAEDAAPLLVGNTVIGGSIVLCGTAVGCTLSENIICDSRGSGVLLSYRAAGTLTANVILRSAGVGLEVTSSSTPTVHRNQVLDSGGVGLLVRGVRRQCGARRVVERCRAERAWHRATAAGQQVPRGLGPRRGRPHPGWGRTTALRRRGVWTRPRWN